MKDKKDRKKKEKVTYVDDGRTVVDMSQLGGRRRDGSTPSDKRDHSFRAQWRTYIDSVKMMILPMLCVIGIIFLAFLIFYLIALTQL